MAAAIEAWPVGGQWALFNPGTGAVALANTTSMTIWRCLSESGGNPSAPTDHLVRAYGLDHAQAEGVVRSQLDAWRSGGLLVEEPATPADPFPNIHPLDGRATLRLTTRAGHFDLRCEDAYARDVMARVLRPLQDERAERSERTLLELGGASDAYWVARDGKALLKPGNISFARHEILKQMLIDPAEPERASAVLHAAAVTSGGAAVLIAGECGAGKSTLTAHLVAHGAGYIGDDLIPVERNGAWIGTFPVGLSVKSGAFEVVGRLFPPQLWTDEIRINHHRLRYVDLSGHRPEGNRVPVGMILFPQYLPNAVFTAEPVTPVESLQLLLASGSRAVGERPSLEGLCDLVDRTPAWRVCYSDWHDVARFIETG